MKTLNNDTPTPSARVIARRIMTDNPGKRFATHKDGKAVAYWSDELQRWAMLGGWAITGSWVQVGDLLVNGKPMHEQSDWQEIFANDEDLVREVMAART